MRRLLKDIATNGGKGGENKEIGDTSTLEDFGVLAKLRAAEEDE
jgi:hypothetical protein